MTRLPTYLALLVCPLGLACSAQEQPPDDARADAADAPLQVVVDARLEEPLRAIAEAYRRRTGTRVALRFLPTADVHDLAGKKGAGSDVVLGMPADVKGETPVRALRGATNVAWKYPSMEPVWAAAVTDRPAAAAFVRFAGGPTGHRLWSESKAGFTITSGKTHAEAFAWVAEHRVKHTYPLTAARMLAECGGIRDGVCIDVGCGPGHLDVELARRSNFKIIGLDIDPDMKPLFEKRAREAGLGDRLSFVVDYAITDGDCLVICGSDGGLEQGLQKGLVDVTNLKITALYASEKAAKAAEERIRKGDHAERIVCKVGAIGELPFEEASFDLVAGVGPMLIFEKDKAKAMREVHRVLRTGGAALVGGKFLGMPDHRKVPSETLRRAAAATGIPSIRVYDDMGQWVEIRKGIKDRGFRD